MSLKGLRLNQRDLFIKELENTLNQLNKSIISDYYFHFSPTLSSSVLFINKSALFFHRSSKIIGYKSSLVNVSLKNKDLFIKLFNK